MNTKEYIEWIMTQPHPGYTLAKTDDDHIQMENDSARGEINIYHLEMDIIELKLESKKDGEVFFFLHFELKDDDHAKGLYKEMAESLQEYGTRKGVRILLSCTSGLTTSFFAQKLNEAAETLSLQYEFNAEAYTDLFTKGADYDVILLAPQIAYQKKKTEGVFKDKPVIAVPAQIFASYDAGKMITMIADELEKLKLSRDQIAVAKVMRDIENNACIFVINMTHDVRYTKYIYRLYNRGSVVFSEEAIKTVSRYQDISDILDTVFARLREDFRIDAVSISIPGVLDTQDGPVRISYEKMGREFSDIYGLPVFVCHNTSAVVFGYYAGQDKYNVVSYHSQPAGGLIGGQGSLYKGTPVKGKNQMGGELQGLFRFVYPGHNANYQTWDVDEVKRAVVLYLIANICETAPEVILVRSPLTPDMDELKEELGKYVDGDCIPELVYAADVSEYAYLGTMLNGLYYLKKIAAAK